MDNFIWTINMGYSINIMVIPILWLFKLPLHPMKIFPCFIPIIPPWREMSTVAISLPGDPEADEPSVACRGC